MGFVENLLIILALAVVSILSILLSLLMMVSALLSGYIELDALRIRTFLLSAI